MDRWIERKGDQLPRRGEIIMVRSGAKLYRRALIAEDRLRWWWYEPDQEGLGIGHGTLVAYDTFTHWTLLDSPY